MKTSEVRQGVINIFTKIVNDMSDKKFDKMSKDITNEGIVDIAGKSRVEQIQMFTNRISTLNREELIKKRRKMSEFI